MLRRLTPWLFLAAVSVFVFLPSLSGYGVFVGDSDRMNHSLTTFLALLRGFSDGVIPIWNDAQFGGYSLLALPYYYPNPVPLLAYLIGIQDLYFFAGAEAAVLFFFAGATSYAYLRLIGRSRLAACAGGILYQTCGLSVLKVSQNDMSFMVVILIPVLLSLIRISATRVSASLYLALFATVAFLLNFTFLQKVGYAAMLAALYTSWVALRRRSWRPILFGVSAAIPALLISVPRLVTVGRDLADGTRYQSAFSAPVNFIEVLRWFDERIFGATLGEAISLHNGINLHEGFLLYITSFAPFVLLYTIAKRLPWRRNDGDAQFSVYMLLICFVLVFTGTGAQLLRGIFLNLDFIHSRILIIAVLPSCVLLTLFIDDLRDRMAASPIGSLDHHRQGVVVAAVAYVAAVEIVAQCLRSYGVHAFDLSLSLGPSSYILAGSALLRIVASALAILLLSLLAMNRQLLSRQVHLALVALMVSQGAAYAMLSVWGPEHWQTPATFTTGTRLMARPGDFRVPSTEALADVRRRLEADAYRTAFVCPPTEVAVFCAPQISGFWRLRSIDGYVSSVPRRVAAFLSPGVVGLRSVAFESVEQIDWPKMGLMNVKYALRFRPELFTNAVHDAGKPARELSASDLTIHENPAPVAPRMFLVHTVESAADTDSAVRHLFPNGHGNPLGHSPEQQSVAEGFAEQRDFATEGSIAANFLWNHVIVELSPWPEERFLVVNERYESDWVAIDNTGAALPVFPTNVMMMGVIVPGGVQRVVFSYKPFAVQPVAWAFYLSGLLLATMTFGVLLGRRRVRQSVWTVIGRVGRQVSR